MLCGLHIGLVNFNFVFRIKFVSLGVAIYVYIIYSPVQEIDTMSETIGLIYIRKVTLIILKGRVGGELSFIRIIYLIPNNNYGGIGIMFSCDHSQYPREKGLGWCVLGCKSGEGTS